MRVFRVSEHFWPSVVGADFSVEHCRLNGVQLVFNSWTHFSTPSFRSVLTHYRSALRSVPSAVEVFSTRGWGCCWWWLVQIKTQVFRKKVLVQKNLRKKFWLWYKVHSIFTFIDCIIVIGISQGGCCQRTNNNKKPPQQKNVVAYIR